MIADELKRMIEGRKFVLQQSLLEWERNQPRFFPWREEGRTAYEILLAELLLKRTSATAAARIYESFLAKYPTSSDLARATEDQLATDLAPVGLHVQRAKAVVRLARHLVVIEGGRVPRTLDRLLQLPGLGDYGARAVLSFGWNLPAAVVDSNVVRVLQRVFRSVISEKAAVATFQSVANELLPGDSHREFNFGMLDLGALVCRYSAPRCEVCPLNSFCDYNLQAGMDSAPRMISNLRQVRKAAGMSLAQLAKQSGVAKPTIVNIELGRTMPLRQTLERLAPVLGVKTEQLWARRNSDEA